MRRAVRPARQARTRRACHDPPARPRVAPATSSAYGVAARDPTMATAGRVSTDRRSRASRARAAGPRFRAAAADSVRRPSESVSMPAARARSSKIAASPRAPPPRPRRSSKTCAHAAMTCSSVASAGDASRSALKTAAARGRAMPGRWKRPRRSGDPSIPPSRRSAGSRPRDGACPGAVPTNARGAVPGAARAAAGARPLCPYYSRAVSSRPSSGVTVPCALTNSGANWRGLIVFPAGAWYVSCCDTIPGLQRCESPVRNVTHFLAGNRDPGDPKLGILAPYPHAAPTDDSLSRGSPRRPGDGARAERPRQVQGTGRVRHQGRAERAVERSAVPLGEGDGARSDLRRRVEQPGDRLRARRASSNKPSRRTRKRSSWIRRT